MSLSPLITHVKPAQALYAPYTASGGGGGGGGSVTYSSITVSSIAGGVDINSGPSAGQGLNMQNGTISLDTGLQANIYYNAGDSNVYIQGLSTHTVNIGTAANTKGLTVSDNALQTTASTIGAPYGQLGIGCQKVAASQPVTYIGPAGSAAIASFTPPAAQHFLRVEMPVKVQGWSAANGTTNSYAPDPKDWLSIYPLGNVAGSPAPVFTTLQMSQVSSINNDWEGTVSCVYKVTNPGATGIFASTAPGTAYSTSVEVGSAIVVTDLGT